MKKASSILFKIGRICAIVFAVLSVAAIAAGVVFLVYRCEIQVGDKLISDENDIIAFGTLMTSVGAAFLVINVFSVLFCGLAEKSLETDIVRRAKAVVALIFGIFGLNVFNIAASIFALGFSDNTTTRE